MFAIVYYTDGTSKREWFWTYEALEHHSTNPKVKQIICL